MSTVRKIAMPVVLRCNDNQFSKAYGKYFPEVYQPKTLSLKGMLSRLAMEQSVYSPDIVNGVIDKLTAAMVELLQEGQSVKWDGYGTFIPYLENENGGVTEAEIRAGQANPLIKIAGVHIRFIPENVKGEELTSRKFAQTCTFDLKGIYKKTTYGEGDEAETHKSIETLEEFRKRNGN